MGLRYALLFLCEFLVKLCTISSNHTYYVINHNYVKFTLKLLI